MEVEAEVEDKADAAHVQQLANTSRISPEEAALTRGSRDSRHKAEAKPETQGTPPRAVNIISRADD